MISSVNFISQIYTTTKKKVSPYVFIDRDGTIIEEVPNIVKEEQIILYKDVIQGINILNKAGFNVIVITNQPAVARGWITEKRLKKINNYLQKNILKSNALISAIYSCPHHPEANLKKYRIKCSCRKPGIFMYRKAGRDFKIDFKNSYMIGDRTADIKAGERAGLTTILVGTGYVGGDQSYKVKPDFKANGFIDAVKIIIGRKTL